MNKIRTTPFEPQDGPCLDVPQYLEQCKKVLESEILSGFRGNSTAAFYGGNMVKEFEENVEEYFGQGRSCTAVSCNSATSALYMACAAIGLKPGDEVIVSPWSMSCSATMPLLFGAIPVFADIHPDHYSLDPVDVEKKVTPRTKAIIVVDLFGLPYLEDIDLIARKHNLFVIEDAAQAIGAKRHGVFAGLLGDIGVYSFTQGKHMTAGEGGVAITNDKKLAEKLQMIRNHAEAVTSDSEGSESELYDDSLIGMNLRMTEMQAAILMIELRRLHSRISERRTNAWKMIEAFESGAKEEVSPLVPTGYTHSLYCLPIKFEGIDFIENVGEIVDGMKEMLVGDRVRLDRGVPVSKGYIKPLYKMPCFQSKKHWAFGLTENAGGSQDYSTLELPNVELLQRKGFMVTLLHALQHTEESIGDITKAIKVVTDNVAKNIS